MDYRCVEVTVGNGFICYAEGISPLSMNFKDVGKIQILSYTAEEKRFLTWRFIQFQSIWRKRYRFLRSCAAPRWILRREIKGV
jgi:hypothetical protein